MYIKDLQTPALIVDQAIMYENIEQMRLIMEDTDMELRPHYKSHKCADLAHMQITYGAKGMTCAKLSEAEDLVDCGINDILIANQVVQPEKIRRLADLAGKCRLTICVDDAQNIIALSDAAVQADTTIHCLVEYEIGMQRCGVTEKEEVLYLAQLIEAKPNLVFEGIQAYAGHVSHMVSEAQRRQQTLKNQSKLLDLLGYLRENEVEVKTISGGSTGTSEIKAEENLYTELQAGSYLLMDSTYAQLGLPFENALFILSTVVSVRDDLAVIDCGVKTCGLDQGMPEPLDFDVAQIVASEEHLQLHSPTKKLCVGDKVWLIPAHCCSTVNLYDKMYLFDEDEQVIDRLMITGRGMGR